MTTMFLAFLFVSALIAMMCVGLFFGRKPISGSCGGMKALGMDVECEICGGDPDACKEPNTFSKVMAAKLSNRID
ncbi:MAG: (Na+)-NQR maturation NqrM [Pseudomonadales bacterium]|nr:(Na+)-NQR maturation NqrM [Pseudomonadales bacterium]